MSTDRDATRIGRCNRCKWGVYGNGLSKIYRQPAPLPRNAEPGAVLLDVGLHSTHFAHDVAIRELLVIRDAGGDHGSMRPGRDRGSGSGTKGQHDSERHARTVRENAAQPDGAGNGNAFAVGKPVVERVGTGGDGGACAQRAPDREESTER